MSQFIPLDEAASRLKISKEQLNDLREAGKIRAYRDGASWKFRADELDKLAADPKAWKQASVSDIALEAIEEPSDPSDSILVSDDDAVDDANRPPSTVIGKPGAVKGDSDLELQLDSDKNISNSDVRLASPASDILAPGISGSNVLGAPGSESLAMPTPPSGKFEDLDELEIDLETESSKILSASEVNQLKSKDQGSELELVESDILQAQEGAGGAGLVEETGDDDLILSEGGSDITLSAGDSGINLISPTDSGLALDDISLELGGSGIEPLELGEAEEHLVLEEDLGSDIAPLQAEDDFSLTPLMETGGEESDDSGSQVIALDSASDLGEDVETILGDDAVGAVALQPAEGMPVGVGPMIDTSTGGIAAGIPSVPDTTFSGWNITSLVGCILVLAIGSMMMFDLLRSIWGWNEPYAVTSSLMDALSQWFS
ncbi:MAG: helix-turn-helix domain-containing protein [Pirellulales bacterium]|nr:helix-turn-helix domain-containing protein [Pirellulales bacterium]